MFAFQRPPCLNCIAFFLISIFSCSLSSTKCEACLQTARLDAARGTSSFYYEFAECVALNATAFGNATDANLLLDRSGTWDYTLEASWIPNYQSSCLLLFMTGLILLLWTSFLVFRSSDEFDAATKLLHTCNTLQGFMCNFMLMMAFNLVLAPSGCYVNAFPYGLFLAAAITLLLGVFLPFVNRFMPPETLAISVVSHSSTALLLATHVLALAAAVLVSLRGGAAFVVALAAVAFVTVLEVPGIVAFTEAQAAQHARAAFQQLQQQMPPLQIADIAMAERA